MDDVLVVGGGAAGIIAAWRAAASGARTRLLERNDRLGLKIHISGGGKCNITQAGDMESVRRVFVPQEARFLHLAFRRFTNEDVLDLLRRRGVGVHTRPDGRVFPDSGRADDVVDALTWYLLDAGVKVDYGSRVTGITTEAGRASGAQVGDRWIRAGSVVVAVGGSSYPKTGTTGDGFRWVKDLGHTLVPLRAALAPIYLDTGCRPEYSGIALRDVVLRARQNGREVSRWRADLLFTHHGISGPCALGISRDVAAAMESGTVTLEVDTLPEQNHETLTAELAAAHSSYRGSLRSFATRWLPERLTLELLERSGVEAGSPLHQLARKSRSRLIENLKRWDLGPARAVPLERGEVTAGGVSLEEVDPRTMESRKISGLYLCGEILNIAGPVGGYNLQAAFSTGFAAGEAAAGPGREGN